MTNGKVAKNLDKNLPLSGRLVIIGMVPFFIPFWRGSKSNSRFGSSGFGAVGAAAAASIISIFTTSSSASSGSNGGVWSTIWNHLKNPWVGGPAGVAIVVLLPLFFTVFNTILRIISTIATLASVGIGAYLIYKQSNGAGSS